MDPLFRWIESTSLSLWLGQSPSLLVLPAVLLVHTIGMGVLVGAGFALTLRVWGFAPRISPAAFAQFAGVLWLALAMNVLSGFLLLVAYPTKALTNPLFYAKILLIVVAIRTGLSAWREIMAAAGMPAPARTRWLAAASAGCWILAVALGRLLQYTYTRLGVDFTDV